MYERRIHRQTVLLFCILLAGLGFSWLARAPRRGPQEAMAARPEAAVHLPDCSEPICVYFTDRDLPYGSGPDRPLINAISKAKASVEIAAYDLDIWGLRDALIDTHRRGVAVRMVAEADTAGSPEMAALVEAGVPIRFDRPDGLMHDKFVVIDRRQVWTGSMNFTLNGAYRNDNNLLAFDSPEIAVVYLAEFEEMYADRLFGAYSPAGEPSSVEVAGIPVKVLFSPDDGVQAQIVDLITGAQESVHFMAFSFTSDAIGDALLARQQAGVVVAGVFDESQYRSNRGTEFDRLLEAGLDVRIDGNPDKLHHKVIVVDGRVVITGSYNFSASAEERNDENLLIIEDAGIADMFLEEFRRVFEMGR